MDDDEDCHDHEEVEMEIVERVGGGQMWMKLSGSGNTIASDTSLGLSFRHSF